MIVNISTYHWRVIDVRRAKIPRGARGTVIFGECPDDARIIADMVVDKEPATVISSWTVEACPTKYKFKEGGNDGSNSNA